MPHSPLLSMVVCSAAALSAPWANATAVQKLACLTGSSPELNPLHLI